jgi:hypothetical protein
VRTLLLTALALAPTVAMADPPGPPPACGVSITQLFCYRITQVRKLPTDPQGDAWEVMFEFVNWTNQDVVGIDVAMNTGSLTQTQGGPPVFGGAYIDANGRPFGPGEIRPLGNADIDNDWHVAIDEPYRLRYATTAPGQTAGTPIPHPSVAGTVGGQPTTYAGVYDPQFADSTLPECSTALAAMIPGSTIRGATIETNPRDLDDGDNVRDGFVVILDDFDPGETVSFNWVLLVGDGAEISGYVDPSGTVQGDPMGFGMFSLTLYENGLPADPVFDVNGGFDPPNAFDADQDSDFIWAEDETNGVDQYPVNPVPGGLPGQGQYVGVELGAAVTGPFVDAAAADGDGTFTFGGQPVSMGDNTDTVVPPQVFELDAPRFVLPGDAITLRAEGATPGDTVWFLYGNREGQGPCPPQLSGDCLQLVGAQPFGNAVADATGVAELPLQVPASVPLGVTIFTQAVALRNSPTASQAIGDYYGSEIDPITTGVDPASCPDDDDDGVCNALDLCDGDDALGDLDGDGVCGALDSDADGLFDIPEPAFGTDPSDPDSDDDGLLDGIEVNAFGTDPLLADTDGGGVDDFTEVTVDGTNPLDPADDMAVVAVDPCIGNAFCASMTSAGAWRGGPSAILTAMGTSRVTWTLGWSATSTTTCDPNGEFADLNATDDPQFRITATADEPAAQVFLDGIDWASAEVSATWEPFGANLSIDVLGQLSVLGYLTTTDWSDCGPGTVTSSGFADVTDANGIDYASDDVVSTYTR